MGKCRFFLLDLLRFELGLLQKMTHCRSQTQCDTSLISCLLFLFSIQHHNKSITQFIKRRVKCVVFQLLFTFGKVVEKRILVMLSKFLSVDFEVLLLGGRGGLANEYAVKAG